MFLGEDLRSRFAEGTLVCSRLAVGSLAVGLELARGRPSAQRPGVGLGGASTLMCPQGCAARVLLRAGPTAQLPPALHQS